MDPELRLAIFMQHRVVLANSRKQNMLRVGLHFSAAEEPSAATQHIYLPPNVLDKIGKYKASLDLARFKQFYGHSLEDAFGIWHHRMGMQTEMLVDEYLYTLHYFATGHVFPLPGMDRLPKSNARYELARNASIISGWSGCRLFGVEVSPAIATPDKKSLYFYKKKREEDQDEVENVNEHMLANVTLAQQTTRKRASNDRRTVCASTIYVLHHPHGFGPGIGFWTCGPIEVPRGVGFSRAIARFMAEYQNAAAIGFTTPPHPRNLDPTQVTVVVAVTDIQIVNNPPRRGRRRRRTQNT